MRELYIKQKVFKITDHYPVMDQNGDLVYQVDQDFKLIGNKVRVSNAEGVEIFVVDKEILTFLPRYQISFANGQHVTIKSRFTLFAKQIDVESEGLNLFLQGSFFDYDFEVYQGDRVIGSISKQFMTFGDTYELKIYDESLEVYVLALMIAVDCIKDSQEKS